MKSCFFSSVVFLVLIANACGEEDIGKKVPESLPKISIDQDKLVFDDFEIGVTHTLPLTISNEGKGKLEISEIVLSELTLSDAGQEIEKGKDWVEKATLAGGEKLTIEVLYTAQDSELDEGLLTIKSNDGVYNIPIKSHLSKPRISVESEIDLGRVSVGRRSNKITIIKNLGDVDLKIDELSIFPAQSNFSLSFPSSADSNIANDRSNFQSLELKKGKELFVRVQYKADDLMPAEAEIRIKSNASNIDSNTIHVEANSGPCLEILPASNVLDFGTRRIGEKVEQELTLKNCSTITKLRIKELKLCTEKGGSCEDDGTFSWKTSVPTTFGSQDGGTIKPNEEITLKALFDPSEGESKGIISFKSNDSRYPMVEIPLIGEGVKLVCSTAIASVRKLGDTQFIEGEMTTSVGESVELSAAKSLPFQSAISRYQWAIISRPVGDNGTLTDINGEVTQFFLNLAGDYVFELKVFDKDNVESCMVSRIVVHSVYSKKDLAIQLNWNTPADPDQSDQNGTDLDLHYLHPNGNWNRSPWDIFFNNKTANWGDAASTNDDPTMDIDDVNGAGPETVTHTPTDTGIVYSVGVFYYADRGFGPSYATVKIYVDGKLEFEAKDQYLERMRAFWYVATIAWPSKTITAINRIKVGF